MTTTEKRGFRLPWGGENRKPDDESDAADDDAMVTSRRLESIGPAADVAPAIAAAGNSTGVRAGSSRLRHDDLGRGPFDLEPTPDPEPEAEPEPVAPPVVAEVSQPEPAASPMAWPDIDRAGSAAHVASDAPLPPVRPAIVVDGDSPASPRRVNPLMAGLVKAMRDAARSAREEATAKMRSDAAARLAEIRTQATAAGLTLKQQADDDVAAVREWSKAEMTRIRTETDNRIAKRRADLLSEVEDQAAESQRMQAEVNGAIKAFDAEMNRFFDILLKEDDPARLATLAERLPEAPSFARPMGPAGAPKPRTRAARPAGTAPRRKPSERLAPDAAAAAEAEAIEGLDEAPAAMAVEAATEPELDLEPMATPEPAEAPAFEEPAAVAEPVATTEPEPAPAAEASLDVDLDVDTFPEPDAPAGSLANVLAKAPRIDSPDDLSPEERIALLGFDEPEASADGADDHSPAPVLGVRLEPESDTRAHSAAAMTAAPPLEDVTRVVVTGLSSVAGISAFKSALGAVTGVTSVSVTSGMDHDFVFSVVHADATDLRRAIAAFPAFAAQMTMDEGAVLNFIVSEPAT